MTTEPTSEKLPLGYKGSLAGLRGLLSNVVTKIEDTATSIVNNAQAGTGGTQAIPLEEIFPCADQPRQVFDPKSLEELAQTMGQVGQAQAITVRKVADHRYEIIAGERRFRAAKLAGLTQLDCVVKDCSLREARLLALVENTQRQDLLPIEEAHFLKKVMEENPDLSLDKLAKLLGSHKSTLSEKIQLTEVPENLQNLLYGQGRLFTHRHWRVLSRIEDVAFLQTMIQKAIDEQLSVAELERSLSAAGIKTARRLPSAEQQAAARQMSKENAPLLVKKNGSLVRIRALSVDLQKIEAGSRALLVKELEDLVSLLKAELAPELSSSNI